MPQTPDLVKALYNATTGTVIGYLQPKPYDRRIISINFVDGPAGSVFTMWRGYVTGADVITTTKIGDRNSYDGALDTGAKVLYANESATLEWAPNGGAFATTVTASANIRSQWGD